MPRQVFELMEGKFLRMGIRSLFEIVRLQERRIEQLSNINLLAAFLNSSYLSAETEEDFFTVT